ncbi:tetratricopeptide repeat protein [Rhodococcus sp. 2G]|uniref:tetratricopeptide repeat protein n=1 Tax=Rhodococcus sp. 2G TaxID=1570939 RepID=UPI000B01B4C7|nr:tetratricopeptide repeat protein [Rhodococcus sp. 2G]
MTWAADEAEAAVALRAARLERAAVILRGSVTDARSRRNTATQVRALCALTEVLIRTGELPAAKQSAGCAYSLSRAHDHRAGIGMARNTLAVFELRAGRIHQARDLVDAAIADVGPDDVPTALPRFLFTSALIHRRDGDLRLAHTSYERALALSIRYGDHARVARCHKGLADLTLRFGDPTLATELYEQAVEGSRRVGDLLGEAHALRCIAEQAMRASNLNAATERFELAAVAYERARDRLGLAYTCVGRGELAALRGDPSTALASFSMAIEHGRAVGDRLAQANAHFERGEARRIHGDLENAARDYTIALRSYRELGDALGRANTMRALGDLALSTNAPGRSEPRYYTALAVYKHLDAPNSTGNAEYGLGSRFAAENDDARAIRHFERALRCYEKAQNLLGQARTREALAGLQASQHKQAAIATLITALELYEQIGAPYEYLRCAERHAQLVGGHDRERELKVLAHVHRRGRQMGRWISSPEGRTAYARRLDRVQRAALELTVQLDRSSAAAQIIEDGTSSTLAALHALSQAEHSPDDDVAATLRERIRSLVIQLMQVEGAEVITDNRGDAGLSGVRSRWRAPLSGPAYTHQDLAARRAERDRLLAQLEGLVQRDVRAVLEPPTIDVAEQLRLVAARHPVIQLACPAGLLGGAPLFTVYTSVDGTTTIDRAVIDAHSAAALAAMTPSEPTDQLVPVCTTPPVTVVEGVASSDDAPGIDALFALLDESDDQRLRALGALLFSPKLIGYISANAPEPCGAIRVLVIPDVRIWSVPWAALPYGDQSTSPSRLAESVMVSVAPSLHVIQLSRTARSRESAPTARAIAWLSGVSGEEMERAALDQSFHGQVDHPESARDFLRSLADRSHEFTIASVHGRARVGLSPDTPIRLGWRAGRNDEMPCRSGRIDLV